MSTILVLGCSRRKRAVDGPVPALELYEGGGIPEIRTCLSEIAALRQRTFILSAKHGLLASDDPIAPYESLLTPEAANQMRPGVYGEFKRRVLLPFQPRRVLVLAEPLYFSLLAPLLDNPEVPRIIWEPDIRGGVDRMLHQVHEWTRSG